MVGEKIPVIRGEVTGLPMPAGAEIVVEGWIRPDRVLHEGPFGEWTGYYAGGARPEHHRCDVQGQHDLAQINPSSNLRLPTNSLNRSVYCACMWGQGF